MPHFKILGWLWLAFGSLGSLLVVWTLVTPSAQVDQNVLKSAWVWWTDLVWNFLESAFFVSSALLGIALLRRWRWAQGTLGILGAVLLAVWVLCIVSPSFPPTTLGASFLHLTPL